MSKLVFQLSSSAATAFQDNQAMSEDTLPILQLIRSAGGLATPMHPGVSDPNLSRYFSVDLPSQEVAAKLAAELLQRPNVEAAYVKPDDFPPG